MPYTRGTFLGASIRSFSTSIGWSGQQSVLTVQLVVDASNGDSFAPGNIYDPIYFEFEDFYFYGLLQNYYETDGPDGSPLHEVVCVDPREILDGCKVILGGYSGAVGTLYNIFNVFGYYENTGFGNSYANDTGMPWYRVLAGLNAMANGSATSYGGPINFRGTTYGLDLSELPVPPSYYRVGNVSASILELIAQVCEDTGCDFTVELEAYTIRVRTISRASQPPLGTISAILSSATGSSLVRSRNGLEGRNEITSAFLVGGDVTTMFETDSFTQFWGYDFEGAPIVGSSTYLWGPTLVLDSGVLLTENHVVSGSPFGFPSMTLAASQPSAVEYAPFGFRVGEFQFSNLGAGESVDLNAESVANIVGDVTYPCSTFELRAAKHHINSWLQYLNAVKPVFVSTFGINCPIQMPNRLIDNTGASFQTLLPRHIFNQAANGPQGMAAAVHNDGLNNLKTLYEFVKKHAEEYYGKKYLVPLPFVLEATDPETLKVKRSYEIANAGYREEGSAALGLDTLNEDLFKDQDGRFRAYVKYDSLAGADFTTISPEGTVFNYGDNYLFSEVRVDQNLLLTPAPYALVTMNGAVTDAPSAEGLLLTDITRYLFHASPAEASGLVANGVFGSIGGIAVGPAARPPASGAIPLKSNILTYGPWYAGTTPGKVKFDYDPSLVPWNYGGYSVMDLAGAARVSSAVTSMLVSEMGDCEIVGPPIHLTAGSGSFSLGDVMQASGPNLSGLNVSFNTQGVTTTYRWQTYTPRFGVNTKNSTERIQRLALTGQEMRRALRASIRQGLEKRAVLAAAARTASVHPPWMNRMSPHNVLIGRLIHEPNSSDVRVGASTATLDEALGLLGANDDGRYKATGMMGLDGLIRPFSVDAGNLLLSAYTTPSITGVPNAETLNPWKSGNDMELGIWGDSYDGFNSFDRTPTYTKMRPFALRSPLVLSGWGYDLSGNASPTGTFFLKRSQEWNTGPLDPLWDEGRGTWTVHDYYRGKTLGVASGDFGSTTIALLQGDAPTSETVTVYNPRSYNIPASTPVGALYSATDNKMFVIPEIPSGPCQATLWHENACVVEGSALTKAVNTSQGHNRYAYQNASADGDEFQQYFSLAPGTYQFKVLGITDANSGMIEWSLDDTLITIQDWYSSSTTYDVVQSKSVTVDTDGCHKLSGKVNSQDAYSSGYDAKLTMYSFTVCQSDGDDDDDGDIDVIGGCDQCPDGMSECWKLTATGFGVGQYGADFTHYNGSFILEPPAYESCNRFATVYKIDTEHVWRTDTYSLSFSEALNEWRVYVYWLTTELIAIYSIPADEFDCIGENVFTGGASFYYQAYSNVIPTTITLNAVSCDEDTYITEDCHDCTVVPDNWVFAIGATPATPSCDIIFNRDWFVTHTTECTWTSDEEQPRGILTCDGYNIWAKLTTPASPDYWQLDIYADDTIIATYQGDPTGFDCLTCLTLVRTLPVDNGADSLSIASNYPATILLCPGDGSTGDDASGRLYFSDYTNSLIKTCVYDGSNEETVYSDATAAATALAVTSDKVYWAYNQYIYRANLDGSSPEQIVDNGAYAINDLCIYDNTGEIYFTSEDEQIKKCNLDGTGVASVYSDSNYEFTGIAVDASNRRLYFGLQSKTDLSSGVPAATIARVDVSGANYADAVGNAHMGYEVIAGISLDIPNGKVYYISGNSGLYLKRANIDNSGGVEEWTSLSVSSMFHVALDLTNRLMFVGGNDGTGGIFKMTMDPATPSTYDSATKITTGYIVIALAIGQNALNSGYLYAENEQLLLFEDGSIMEIES